ncbi:MAG TPA: hypothetical protein VGP31_19600 [Planosporangium sp.]|jgi:hypothetical protein|nr:hypothetical protein [Planosporangium sp.]
MFRKLATGVALSAALLLPLTACNPGTDKAGGTVSKPTASPSPKPAELLTAAVAKTKSVNVKFKLGDDKENMSGGYDVTKKMGSVEGDAGGERMQLVVTENDLYMSGLKDLGGKTLHMVVSKLPGEHGLTIIMDPVLALALIGGAATVESPSPNFFQGTLDLNKVAAATPGGKKMIESAVKAAGAKANAVPFNAKVDAQGYVTEFSTTLPGADAGKDMLYNLTLSDFGAPVTVAVPTAKIIEAPAESYKP